MRRLSYSIVDVFSNVPYKGNPLAVVSNTASSLTKTQMQLIARQFNLSETTFICAPIKPGSTYRLRSFLPNGEEVFGAGHNSLGAWWHIIDSKLLRRDNNTESNTYHQELGDYVLPVEVSGSNEINITMSQGSPQFLDKHPDKATLAKALGIQPTEIGFEYDGKTLAEPQVVTTSPARHLLVPVRDKETLDRIDFSDLEALARELAKTNSYNSGVYAFTPVGSETNVLKLEARFFSPGMGMEDPATGSAAGPLAAFLCTKGIARLSDGGSTEIEVAQGLKKGRECRMKLTANKDAGSDSLKIRISGTGVLVAEGSLAVPSVDIDFRAFQS
ncbi:phenazine biosynthesis PhzF protein [Aspergillus spectabilis]